MFNLIRFIVIKKILFGSLIAAFAMISSCSTDFEVIEEWKETMVIYGVLNPNDSAHYVKVTKAFLGEGDAFVMAQNPDSLYYNPEHLLVTLTEVETGHVDTLDAVENIPRDMNNNPVFSQRQVVFKTTRKIQNIYTYQLRARNLSSGQEAVAQTKLVEPADITSPSTSQYQVDFANPTSNFEVKWRTGDNAMRYETIIRFYYNEKNLSTGIIRPDSVDFNLGEIEAPDALGGDELKMTFVKNQFYRNLADKLVSDANLQRHPKGVKFLIYSAAEELHTYMQVSAPSTGIVQERPMYTNITNGIGIFSARLNQHAQSADVNANPYRPDAFMLTSASKDTLCIGQFTGSLNFCDPMEFNPADPCYCD